MSDSKSGSKYNFPGNNLNIQIVETTAGGDAVIHKYANDPQVKATLDTIVQLLQDLQQQHPTATAAQATEIIQAELVNTTSPPPRWQQLQQQLRSLPQDLRNRERWMQGGKAALVQISSDLLDNPFLNAFLAFADGFSGSPE